MIEKNIFFFRIADVTGQILNSLYVWSIVSDRNIFNTGFQLICPIKLDHFRCFPDIFPDIFRRFLPARWWRPDADGTKRCRIGIHIVQYSFCMICSLTRILDSITDAFYGFPSWIPAEKMSLKAGWSVIQSINDTATLITDGFDLS